jgi:hypothetical protein
MCGPFSRLEARLGRSRGRQSWCPISGIFFYGFANAQNRHSIPDFQRETTLLAASDPFGFQNISSYGRLDIPELVLYMFSRVIGGRKAAVKL